MIEGFRKENIIGKGDQISKYMKAGVLGKGRNGEVLLVFDTNTEQYYAMKRFHDRKEAEKEAEILKKSDHPGIPKLHDFFIQEEEAYLVTEYVKGITLEKILSYGHTGLREDDYDYGGMCFVPERSGLLEKDGDRFRTAVKIAEILSCLHSLPTPVVHGDIKPENIIITEQNEVKLIDFGSAHLLSETPERILSTRGYAAPEMRDGRSGLQGDVYAFGMVFAHLMSGKDFDFSGKDRAFLMRMGLSFSEASIAERCLNARERKRYPSGREVLAGLLRCDRKEKIRAGIESLTGFICVDIGGVLAMYGLLSFFVMGHYKGKFLLLSGCFLLLIRLIASSADRRTGGKDFFVISSIFLADR
ncbi:MAG: serine/threonine protein kinase [Lachnospiraceae bacterium]|nr:serine/threonine protein kinase [Lachnospiraceae bacterium]